MADLFRIKAYYGINTEHYNDTEWKLIFDLFLDENGAPCGSVETFGYEEIHTFNNYVRHDLMIVSPDLSVISQEIASFKGEVVIFHHHNNIKFDKTLAIGTEFEYHTDDIYTFTIREMKHLIGGKTSMPLTGSAAD